MLELLQEAVLSQMTREVWNVDYQWCVSLEEKGRWRQQTYSIALFLSSRFEPNKFARVVFL